MYMSDDPMLYSSDRTNAVAACPFLGVCRSGRAFTSSFAAACLSLAVNRLLDSPIAEDHCPRGLFRSAVVRDPYEALFVHYSQYLRNYGVQRSYCEFDSLENLTRTVGSESDDVPRSVRLKSKEVPTYVSITSRSHVNN